MKRFISVSVVVIFSFLVGCASIVSKSTWPVTIVSTPEQADINITDIKAGKKIFTGKTPTTLTLSSKGGFFRGKTYRIDISKEGYTPQTLEIDSTLNGWYLGNIIFGGLIGLLIVDPATGAMWTLDPKDINFVLEKQTAVIPDGQKAFSVISLADVPDNLRDKMIKIK